jgi:hypothetical protein
MLAPFQNSRSKTSRWFFPKSTINKQMRRLQALALTPDGALALPAFVGGSKPFADHAQDAETSRIVPRTDTSAGSMELNRFDRGLNRT